MFTTRRIKMISIGHIKMFKHGTQNKIPLYIRALFNA